MGLCILGSRFGQCSFIFHISFLNNHSHTLVGDQLTLRLLPSASIRKLQQFTWPRFRSASGGQEERRLEPGLAQTLAQPTGAQCGLPVSSSSGYAPELSSWVQASRASVTRLWKHSLQILFLNLGFTSDASFCLRDLLEGKLPLLT